MLPSFHVQQGIKTFDMSSYHNLYSDSKENSNLFYIIVYQIKSYVAWFSQ